MSRAAAAVAAAAVAVGLTGCASADARHELTVYAAASLTEPFGELEAGFEAAHPDVEVTVVHGGSSSLAAQILEGAPADVFASADEAQMRVAAPEISGEPVVFATNTLTIAVPRGNPAGIAGLDDLADGSVVSVICAPQVPCGAATLTLAQSAGLTLRPASQEGSVTDVLGKVATGQADAGVVYATDVLREPAVAAVDIDGAHAVISRYPIATTARAEDSALAGAFVDYVTGPHGRALLADAGFGAP
ncbi:molybdate ABC transporter substrate-binding protein [Demequina activiva]|uniref:Molybdate-binding protein n=1 Tax=Demequina activiva TaxID=1582364 RepID=A0A919UKJ7_9MICO|nr:molybdate ABC transporter substrate-binding protein [Demequina activiva]GIG55045.1 molybdate-binding protein [Demequina activiva]